MESDSIELPPDSEIELEMERDSHLECKVKLIINGTVYGQLTAPEYTTGKFTAFGFKTPKSSNTIINIDKSWKFDFSLFGKIFGLGE